MKNTIKIPIILLILVMSFFIASCEMAPTSDICVSIPPQAYLVKRIAGAETPVTIMIPPGSAPPTYAPTASQIRDLHECKLYVKNGHPDFYFEKMHIDPYLSKHPEVLIVDMAKGQDIVPGDAHIWLSLKIMADAATHIYEQLAQLYPDRKAELKSNLDSLLSDIKILDAELHAQLGPFQGAQFLSLHPSWGYFAADYNLTMISVESEGKEPSAEDLAKLVDLAKEKHVKVIFIQPQTSKQSAQAVAEEIGGEVVAVDPLAKDYIANMDNVSDIFARNLV